MTTSITIRGYGVICGAGTTSTEAFLAIRNREVRNQLLAQEWFPESTVAPCFLAVESGALRRRLAEGGIVAAPWVNRTVLLALTAILEALAKAGLSVADLKGKTVGVAIGTTVGCTFNNEAYYCQWRAGQTPDQAPLDAYLNSNLAALVQHILGIRGPRLVVTNACSSGTDAIGLASSWLKAGLCDLALAGGADELSRIACHGFHSLMLVSDESCTPFGQNRKGLNLGEGAGILLLERGDGSKTNLFGGLRGYGAAGDGFHPTAPHPEGRGLQSALRQAMESAGVDGGMIAMINGHGTGTPANDRAETNGLVAAGLADVPLVSTKGATGHTLGAAGGIEAVFTLMALNEGYLTGTIGCAEVDPDLARDVLGEDQEVTLKSPIGISQSLAFGGGNGVLVLEGKLR